MSKPGFLYTPDLVEYQKVHEFASPIEQWPYKNAKSNKELIKYIKEYNESASKLKIEKYFKEMESYENGNATKKLLQILYEERKKEKR